MIVLIVISFITITHIPSLLEQGIGPPWSRWIFTTVLVICWSGLVLTLLKNRKEVKNGQKRNRGGMKRNGNGEGAKIDGKSVQPEREIYYPRPFWLLLPRLRVKEDCKVKVTVDDEATKVYQTEVYPWIQVCLFLYTKHPISGEIRIGISAIVVQFDSSEILSPSYSVQEAA